MALFLHPSSGWAHLFLHRAIAHTFSSSCGEQFPLCFCGQTQSFQKNMRNSVYDMKGVFFCVINEPAYTPTGTSPSNVFKSVDGGKILEYVAYIFRYLLHQFRSVSYL